MICIHKTFQVLVCIPTRKFALDLLDKIDEDTGGMDQVFHTVPLANLCVPTSGWSNINLQKADQRLRVKTLLNQQCFDSTCMSPQALP